MKWSSIHFQNFFPDLYLFQSNFFFVESVDSFLVTLHEQRERERETVTNFFVPFLHRVLSALAKGIIASWVRWQRTELWDGKERTRTSISLSLSSVEDFNRERLMIKCQKFLLFHRTFYFLSLPLPFHDFTLFLPVIQYIEQFSFPQSICGQHTCSSSHPFRCGLSTLSLLSWNTNGTISLQLISCWHFCMTSEVALQESFFPWCVIMVMIHPFPDPLVHRKKFPDTLSCW